MFEEDLAICVEHDNTTDLEGIAFGRRLFEAPAARSETVEGGFRATDLEDPTFHPVRLIDLARRVHIDIEADAFLLDEILGVFGSSVTNGNDLCPGGLDLVLTLFQESSLLPTEQSAEVAEKDQNRLLPSKDGVQVDDLVSNCFDRCHWAAWWQVPVLVSVPTETTRE